MCKISHSQVCVTMSFFTLAKNIVISIQYEGPRIFYGFVWYLEACPMGIVQKDCRPTQIFHPCMVCLHYGLIQEITQCRCRPGSPLFYDKLRIIRQSSARTKTSDNHIQVLLQLFRIMRFYCILTMLFIKYAYHLKFATHFVTVAHNFVDPTRHKARVTNLLRLRFCERMHGR